MRFANGLRRRGWAVRLGLIACLAVLAEAGAVTPVHASTPNLSGFWVNSANTQSGYTLRESVDESVLVADWAGLPPHQTLKGHFSGTLVVEGNAYDGMFKVTEQGAPGSPPVSVSGHGTFALRSSFFSSLPNIDVTLDTPNGQETFTLENFSSLPLIAPAGVTEEITNPSPQPAGGAVDVGDPTASNASAGARPAARRKFAILGETRFSIPAHQSRKISVSLNKRGRRLLKKRGSLRVHVVVRMNASAGLPAVTQAGVVTIRK